MLATLFRQLTLRLDATQYAALGRREALIGLELAWIAGIGRYWDHPSAGFAQRSGVGSVIYVFALSALLWLMLRPMGAHRREYWNVVAMVGLTSPLAWLYALPVERWTEVESAIGLNLGFLAVVAAWRLLLLARYLSVGCGLPWWSALACTLLPLSAIVTALSLFSLERVVLDAMAGLRREGAAERILEATDHAVINITVLSWWTVIPSLFAYAFSAEHSRRPAN